MLRPLRRLADGSDRAKISPRAADRRRDFRGLGVRVIESTHDDPNRPGAGERHRRITDLIHPTDRPACAASLVDHERGEEDLAFDAIKTPLSNRAIPIRSKTPAGVVPESDGLMLAHSVVRRVMPDAAVGTGPDPDRLSFLDCLRVLPCPWPESSQVDTETWDRRLLREVGDQRLRPRRNRGYPGVIKRKRSNGKKRRPEPRNPPQPTKTFRDAVVLVRWTPFPGQLGMLY